MQVYGLALSLKIFLLKVKILSLVSISVHIVHECDVYVPQPPTLCQYGSCFCSPFLILCFAVIISSPLHHSAGVISTAYLATLVFYVQSMAQVLSLFLW